MKIILGILPLLAILLLAARPAAYAGDSDSESAAPDWLQPAPTENAETLDISGLQESGGFDSPEISEARNPFGCGPAEQSCFRCFVTPEDPAIAALTARINGLEDAFQMAVQWIYVSDEKLNQTADSWLTPHEFLADTPNCPDNPLPGKEVSDCEEQSHALVSLIRAEGIAPENVRVVLGEVTFNNIITGHAWVELLNDGRWLALDPCWGSYWDDSSEKLVRRKGIPFNYYVKHNFPALQVWAYYNDIYYLDPGSGYGDAPAAWR